DFRSAYANSTTCLGNIPITPVLREPAELRTGATARPVTSITTPIDATAIKQRVCRVTFIHLRDSGSGFKRPCRWLPRNEDHSVWILQCGRITDAHDDGGQMAGLCIQPHSLPLPAAIRITRHKWSGYDIGRVARISKKHEQLASRTGSSRNKTCVIDRERR